jgi:uracil permease
MAQFTEILSNKRSSTKALKENLLNCVLGFQHLIAMFGATVLVPILTGLDPSVALFSAGVGTLIFHLCTKRKVPVFLGSSFAFIPIITTVAAQHNGDLRYAQGGIFCAGLVYILVSFLIKKIGLANIKKLLPAQVVGPMIMVIGLNLIPVALGMTGVNSLMAGDVTAVNQVKVAAITLATALLVRAFAKGFLKQISILIAVVVGYFVSSLLGLISVVEINNASFMAVPSFTLPKFDMAAILVTVPVVLAVFMEHVGDITTNGQVVGKNFIEDPGLNRTLLGDGLATLAASLVGGPANTTYGENTGVLALTKNYNPAILRITAVFAILLSFIGKFGAVIRTIPNSVMGAISLILFSMIAIIGVQTIKREKVEFNVKNISLMATILFIGLSGNILKQPIGIAITNTVSISGLSLAAIVGVSLNVILMKINNK